MSQGTSTAAARLYAGLDQLLVEHVDLTANVVQTAISKGPASVQTKTAEGPDLLMAENHMAGTGAVLAQGIVASMPSKFTAAYSILPSTPGAGHVAGRADHEQVAQAPGQK